MIDTWNSTCSCTLFVTTRDLFFSHHRANWDVTLVLLYTILSDRSEVDLNRLYKNRPRFTHLKLKTAALITIRFLIRFLKKLLAGCEHECGKGLAVYLIYATKKLFCIGSLSLRTKQRFSLSGQILLQRASFWQVLKYVVQFQSFICYSNFDKIFQNQPKPTKMKPLAALWRSFWPDNEKCCFALSEREPA